MRILRAEFVKSCARLSDCPDDGLPEVAVVGRSNVGKSSLLNCLLNRKGLAKVSGTPGKTRLINFFRVTVDPKPARSFYLVDLPGYGYARVSQVEREAWGKWVEGYLIHRSPLRGLIVLLDIRHEPSPLDQQLLAWIHSHRIPFLLVATKADQIPRGHRSAALKKIREGFSDTKAVLEIFPFSSKTHEGREALLQKILSYLEE